MQLSIIVAYTPDRVIGKNNELLWHLPADMRFFKQTTTGNIVVMGRKTYDSIGRPLPNRTNIVISRNDSLMLEGVHVVASLNAALALAQSLNTGDQTTFIIGGAQVYQLALPLATHLIITEVAATLEGDAFFPEIIAEEWVETDREAHQADEKNAYNYSFVQLRRAEQ
jgi:dihydrofolate reductase